MRRADAWFELTDALLMADAVPVFAYLSLDAVHRRGYGDLYAALARGRLDETRLRAMLAAYRPAGPPVFAVDATVWTRNDAECSPGRGYSYHSYHPSRHSAGQPIVAGWCYQLIVQLELARTSWTAPVDVQRLAPGDKASLVAAEQVQPSGVPVVIAEFPTFTLVTTLQQDLELGSSRQR